MEDKKQQTEEALKDIFGGSVDTIGSNDDMSKSIQLNAPDTTPILMDSPVVAGGDNLNINVNVTQNLIQREVERAVNSILETTSNPADIKKNYREEYQAGNSNVTQSNFFESNSPPSSVISGIPINNSFVNNFTNNTVVNPVYDTRTTVSRNLSPVNTTQGNTSIVGSPPSTLNMSFNSNLSSRQMEIMQQHPDLFTFEKDHEEINQINNNEVGNLVAGVASNNYNNRTAQSDAIKRHLDIYTESSNSRYGYNASREIFGSLIRSDTKVENDQITKDRTQSVTATIIETEKAKALAEFYGYPEFFDKERPVQQYPKTTDSPYMMFHNRSEINNDQLTRYGIDYSRSWTGLKELPEKLKFDTKFATNLADRETLRNVRIDPVYNTDKSGNIIKPTWYNDLQTTENTETNNSVESSNNTQMLSPGDSVNTVGVENNYNVMQSPMSVNADQNITNNDSSEVKSGNVFPGTPAYMLSQLAFASTTPQTSPPQSPIDLQGVESNYNTSQLNQNNQQITDISTTMASPLAMPSPESPTTVNNIDNSVVDNSVNVSNTNISSNILPGTPASMIAQLTMATTSTTNATDDKTVAISPPAEGEFFIENAPGNLSSNEAKSRLTDDSNPNYLKFDSPEQADDAASRLEAGNKLLEQYKDTELTDRQREILQQYPHLFANTDQYNGRERNLYIPQPDEIADEIARGDTEYLSQMLGDHLESYGTSNNNPIWKKYRDFGAGRTIAGGSKLKTTDGDEYTFEARRETTSPFVAQTEEANALAEFYGLPKRFSNDPTNPDVNLPYMMVQAVRGSIDSQTTTASNETKTNENFTSNPTANITQLAELPSLIDSTIRSPIAEPGSYDDVENIRAGENYGANNPNRRPDMSKVGDGNPDVGFNPVYIRNPDGTIRRQEYDTPSPEPSPPQAPIDLQGVESNYTQILSPDDSVNAIGVENNYNVMQSPMSVSTDQNITNNNTSETNLNIIAGSPAAMISQLAFATIQNESSYVNPNSPEARINNTSVTNTSVTNTSSYVNPNSPEGRVRTPPATNTSVTNTSVTNTSSYVNPNSPEARINNTSESSAPQEPIDLQGVEENYSVLQTNTNDTTNEVNSNVDSMSYLNNSIIDNSNVSNVSNDGLVSNVSNVLGDTNISNDGLVSNVSNVLGDTNISNINQTNSNTQQTNTNVNHNINNNQISSNEVNNMLLSQYSNMNYIASTYNQSTNKTSSDSYSPIRHSDNTNLHANINSNKTTFESVSYNPSSINENITKILNNSIGDNYSSAISTISKSSNMDFTHNIKNIIQQLIMENESRKEQEEENKQMNASPISEMMVGESEIEEQDLKDFEPAETTNINDYMLVSDPDLSMFIKNINSPPVWRTVLS